MATIGGIEVFEVGYKQLQNMISNGDVNRPAYNTMHWYGPDTYVIVLCDVHFGDWNVSKPVVWCGYVETEVEMALPPQYEDMAKYGMDYRYCRELEVWHVVDDAELWEVWDMEADAAAGDVLAAEAMQAVFGVDRYVKVPRCVVCKDAEYGPWVTVALPEGARYMCEDCFDATNTARFATGKMPLRLARCYS